MLTIIQLLIPNRTDSFVPAKDMKYSSSIIAGQSTELAQLLGLAMACGKIGCPQHDDVICPGKLCISVGCPQCAIVFVLLFVFFSFDFLYLNCLGWE